MLYIKKNNRTPHIFLDAKSRFENYDDIPSEVKKELKNYLIDEQGGLCAYCMARISEKESTIEHYIPRNGDNADPTLAIEYRNLLAVCCNGRKNGINQHCDVSKGDELISIDPCRKSDIEQLYYKTSGKICCKNNEYSKDLDKTLNLNNATLINNRKAALISALEIYRKKSGGRWSKDFLRRCLDRLVSKDPKTPYAGIIIFELNNRLQRT